jgi:hypothetical protein
VLVICDGLRADHVRADWCPTIARLASAGTFFAAHRAIFPSATRASSASIATGCWPRRHGLHGNQMALSPGGKRAVFDVGKPAFFPLWRETSGGTLRVPTLAERLAGRGRSIVCSNVSPGAAYAQDPDHHGWVYHRAGSFAPGGRAADDHQPVTADAGGDAAMTRRFVDEILLERRPPHAVLWLVEPDKTQHAAPLGSPQARTAIAAADSRVAEVAAAVERLCLESQDVLLLVGSDHGHETATGAVPVERLLRQSPLVEGAGDALLVAPQGSSALVYLDDRLAARSEAIAAWLAAQPWTAEVLTGPRLAEHGIADDEGLAIAFSMARDEALNAFGVPGSALVATRDETTTHLQGFGLHGGLGRYETSPFLLALGRGFAAGQRVSDKTSLTDIAPTVARHHGLDPSGFDGRPLQNA